MNRDEVQPGPWKVNNDDLSDPWNDTAWVTDAEGRLVGREANPATARLIAAAPEMAELLALYFEREDEWFRLSDARPFDPEATAVASLAKRETLTALRALLSRIRGEAEVSA